ncbi:MAG TPA: DoxX family protein [Blastocatellia bacterium]|nr:DoxX family protein [Blastocatellia bacterium]
MFEQRTLSHTAYQWETKAPAAIGYREIGYALLRVTFGVNFLMAGIGKFIMGIGNFEAGLEKQFAGKLPLILLKPFGYALPFAELIVGALIVLGLFNLLALVLSGLELVVLTFGIIVAGDAPTAAHNTQYALVNFVLLWFAGYNGYSIDRLIRARSSQENLKDESW